MSRLRFRRRTRSGQGLVEFALVLPILLTFFATALDLGRIAYAQVTVANAAREGAFQAAKTPTSFIAGTDCTDANESTNAIMCRTLLESTGSAVTVSPSDVAMACDPDCTVQLGHTVNVTVTGHFRLLTPLLSTFFGGQDLTFSSTSRTQLEVLPTPDPAATPAPTPTPTPSPTPTPTPTPTPSPGCGLPSAGFTHTTSPSSDQSPVTLTVVDTSTSPGTGCAINTWTWDWGDGTTSTGQSPSPHIYGRPASGKTTTYLVTLTVANGTGPNTSGAVNIKVKP
jgi:Flp pilus assembly protein TadG